MMFNHRYKHTILYNRKTGKDNKLWESNVINLFESPGTNPELQAAYMK